MFRDYQANIGVDLCFQSFEEELAQLPGKYLTVLLHEHGCVALRPFDAETVEMKRLFVYPAARGKGLGKQLTLAAIDEAIERGYRHLHLDTLKSKMPSAVALYQTLGFVEVPAEGGGNVMPDLVDMELDLERFAAQRDRS